MPLDAKHHVFALLPEFSDLRPGVGFVPGDDAQPLPTAGLHGVGEARQLPPVGKDEAHGPVPGHAPALPEPHGAPGHPAVLVLGVAQHGRVGPFGARGLVLLGRVGLPCRGCGPAAGIRRIREHQVNALVRQGLQNGQGIALVQGNSGGKRHCAHEISTAFWPLGWGSRLSCGAWWIIRLPAKWCRRRTGRRCGGPRGDTVPAVTMMSP